MAIDNSGVRETDKKRRLACTSSGLEGDDGQ